jgi:hypothetical protein
VLLGRTLPSILIHFKRYGYQDSLSKDRCVARHALLCSNRCSEQAGQAAPGDGHQATAGGACRPGAGTGWAPSAGSCGMADFLSQALPRARLCGSLSWNCGLCAPRGGSGRFQADVLCCGPTINSLKFHPQDRLAGNFGASFEFDLLRSGMPAPLPGHFCLWDIRFMPKLDTLYLKAHLLELPLFRQLLHLFGPHLPGT